MGGSNSKVRAGSPRVQPITGKLLVSSFLLLCTILLLNPYDHILPASAFILPGHGGKNERALIRAVAGDATNQTQTPSARPKRVAIIGAGASGTSAAFFLRRAATVAEKRLSSDGGKLLGDIVVFDKEDYVGGRSTVVYPHGDKSLRAQELGGSIFVASNKNMVRAAEYFNLNLEAPGSGGGGTGFWDGEQFLFRTTGSADDSARMIERYGLDSLVNTDAAVSTIVNGFLKLYDPAHMKQRGSLNSVEAFAADLGLGDEYTAITGEKWARDVVKVSEEWLNEMIGGSTRANYGTDVNVIHGLGAGISMATDGASHIEGGNYQIFERMLEASGATVHLGTKVTDIVPVSKGNEAPQFRVKSINRQIDDKEPFDAVFFAAPWASSPIAKGVASKFEKSIPAQPYVHLFVTYLTTTKSHPQPSFFGLAANASVPTAILTTASTKGSTTSPYKIQSMQWLGETQTGSGEYVVKIFSLKKIDDGFLKRFLGEKPSWILRKEWDAYPLLKPITNYAPVQPMKGLHYLAAQEAWISTMETQTVSGREAVARTVQEWWGLGLGECEDGDSWDWTCSL
ncbi:hypothetical protein IAT40_001168 [Kwoniella sp. CBS 6097]